MEEEANGSACLTFTDNDNGDTDWLILASAYLLELIHLVYTALRLPWNLTSLFFQSSWFWTAKSTFIHCVIKKKKQLSF